MCRRSLSVKWFAHMARVTVRLGLALCRAGTSALSAALKPAGDALLNGPSLRRSFGDVCLFPAFAVYTMKKELGAPCLWSQVKHWASVRYIVPQRPLYVGT